MIDYTLHWKYLNSVYEQARPYQRDWLDYARIHPRAILASPGGTGKTLMLLAATLYHRPNRILIICSRNALYTWRKELQKWFPEYYSEDTYTVIKGQPIGRKKLWSKANGFIWVVTPKTLAQDMQQVVEQKWGAIICDEWHKWGLRNKTTIAANNLRLLQKVPVIYPGSGSGVRKGPQDLWNLLNLMDKDMWKSYWAYVHTFCHVIDSRFGKEIGVCKNIDNWAKAVAPYYYRIPKSVTKDQVPALTRVFVDLDMNPRQEEVYRKLDEEMYVETDKGMLVASTVIAKVVKLRQLLACPRIHGIDDDGAMIENIMEKIREQEPVHAVIFTPWREAITHFERYIKEIRPEKGKDNERVRVWSLMGGADEDEIKRKTTEFREQKGVMLCTTMFAQSFEFESADNCHFAGYEWNQDDNEQCEWRLQRLTSNINQPITSYYYSYLNTIDQDILDVLNQNTKNAKQLFGSMERLIQTLKRKREERLNAPIHV